jgi:hypothetical protein
MKRLGGSRKKIGEEIDAVEIFEVTSVHGAKESL